MKKGRLFVISGPSGVGKGTICDGLLSGEGAAQKAAGEGPVLSVSVTTRRPRLGEKDGVSYRFVKEEAFRSMIARDEFLECAE
ncbi:MAG: guanylate kinase, partial [Clostridiales Family XIII bacterium]|nr:guanylate kinase [Clostridiales Family XIII bacterium]